MDDWDDKAALMVKQVQSNYDVNDDECDDEHERNNDGESDDDECDNDDEYDDGDSDDWDDKDRAHGQACVEE